MLPVVRTFGDNLARERKRRGITQVQLAEWLAVKQAQVSAWEKGRRLPSAGSIERIAKALSRVTPCPAADLLAGVLTEYDRLRGSTVPLAPAPVGDVLTPNETRAVTFVRGIPEAQQPVFLDGFEALGQTFRHLQRLQSAERGAHNSAPTSRKARGKR